MNSLPFTVQVPLFNETEALEFGASFWRAAGVEPHYVLDSKASAETRQLARHLGLNTSDFENPGSCIEHGYRAFAEQSPTRWIFRLDADEVISPEALQACVDHVTSGASSVLGFQREQLFRRGSSIVTADHERFAPERHVQWRLFDRETVEYDVRIHTPGFHLSDVAVAPPSARIYHLSWIFLSWDDRLAKSARYDESGQPAANRENQLFDLDSMRGAPLAYPALDQALSTWFDTRSLTTAPTTRSIGVSKKARWWWPRRR